MRKTMFVLTMVALPLAGPTGADQAPAPNTRVKASPAKTPTPGPLAAKVVLAAETRIHPELVLKVTTVADPPNLKDQVAALKKKANDVLGSQWMGLYYVCYGKVEHIKECGRKAFSANDQKAAGCLPTETVQACSEKLLKWCVYGEGISNRYRDCRDRRPPLLKDLESLEQEIRLIRPKVAAYADY